MLFWFFTVKWTSEHLKKKKEVIKTCHLDASLNAPRRAASLRPTDALAQRKQREEQKVIYVEMHDNIQLWTITLTLIKFSSAPFLHFLLCTHALVRPRANCGGEIKFSTIMEMVYPPPPIATAPRPPLSSYPSCPPLRL